MVGRKRYRRKRGTDPWHCGATWPEAVGTHDERTTEPATREFCGECLSKERNDDRDLSVEGLLEAWRQAPEPSEKNAARRIARRLDIPARPLRGPIPTDTQN